MIKMLLTKALVEDLLKCASANPRLRASRDLRTSADDNSQRILNALLPGTRVPIHRHRSSAETMIVVYGVVDTVFYDDNRCVTERHKLSNRSERFGIQIPPNQWHTVEVDEPCVIIEFKDGAYAPLLEADILDM